MNDVQISCNVLEKKLRPENLNEYIDSHESRDAFVMEYK